MRPSDPEIDAFWTWFAGVAPALGVDLEDPGLLDELDAHVARLGDVGWEVGPGEAAECALVVSPDGVRERLLLTERIAGRAPAIPGWEVHAAKPPKTWGLQFEMECDLGRAIEVDARAWRYVLWRNPDRTFDVFVEQPNLRDVEEADRYLAAIIVVEGIVGERTRLLHLPHVEAVQELPPERTGEATGIHHLASHLARLVGEDGGGR